MFCGCGKCICGVNRKLTEANTTNKLTQFLMGLNELYEAVKNQILMLEPLPSVNKSFVML